MHRLAFLSVLFLLHLPQSGASDSAQPEQQALRVELRLVDGSDAPEHYGPEWNYHDDEFAFVYQESFGIASESWHRDIGDFTLSLKDGVLAAHYATENAAVTATTEFRLPRRNGRVIDPGADGYLVRLDGGNHDTDGWSVHADLVIRVVDAASTTNSR